MGRFYLVILKIKSRSESGCGNAPGAPFCALIIPGAFLF